MEERVRNKIKSETEECLLVVVIVLDIESKCVSGKSQKSN
jgi:hypothetical protein